MAESDELIEVMDDQLRRDLVAKELEERYVKCAACKVEVNMDGRDPYVSHGNGVVLHKGCSLPSKPMAERSSGRYSPAVIEHAGNVPPKVQLPSACSSREAGSVLEACTTGEGLANKCANSRWGQRSIFDGPCGCGPCHDR